MATKKRKKKAAASSKAKPKERKFPPAKKDGWIEPDKASI